jgi:hypothetical protein
MALAGTAFEIFETGHRTGAKVRCMYYMQQRIPKIIQVVVLDHSISVTTESGAKSRARGCKLELKQSAGSYIGWQY